MNKHAIICVGCFNRRTMIMMMLHVVEIAWNITGHAFHISLFNWNYSYFDVRKNHHDILQLLLDNLPPLSNWLCFDVNSQDRWVFCNFLLFVKLKRKSITSKMQIATLLVIRHLNCVTHTMAWPIPIRLISINSSIDQLSFS